MRLCIILLATLLLGGCSTSEKLLEESTPQKTKLAAEQKPAEQNGQVPPQSQAPSSETSQPMYQTPPALTIDTNKKYTATLATAKGTIELELFAKNTPATVNNFVFLAREKFYDGVIFHRTIADFMIQGGDPTGTGMGGPGYKFPDEAFTGEYTRGTVAMANSGPDTNGSQFFIMHKDTALPKSYVIFGKVVSGLEVVDAIATAPTQAGSDKPQSPVAIESITIQEE